MAEVPIEIGGAQLAGDLVVPQGASGIVVFAHGSGSSRHSPRNRYVAEVLQEGGLATLLFDLLTDEEEAVDLRTREHRFDIDLLGSRTTGAVDWVGGWQEVSTLPVGTFGASTGAAAALVAAAERPDAVEAAVSRGGRPDLAGVHLPRVVSPVLLIVGGDDAQVLDLNRSAMDELKAETSLEVVPGATHLFEEPGALEVVAEMARDFLLKHLGG